jgi:hypothetical protein
LGVVANDALGRGQPAPGDVPAPATFNEAIARTALSRSWHLRPPPAPLTPTPTPTEMPDLEDDAVNHAEVSELISTAGTA